MYYILKAFYKFRKLNTFKITHFDSTVYQKTSYHYNMISDPSVFGIKDTFTSPNAVSITWAYPDGCYQWTAISASIGVPTVDNKIKETFQHNPNTTWLDLTGLKNDHSYTIEFTLYYKNTSSVASYHFRTGNYCIL